MNLRTKYKLNILVFIKVRRCVLFTYYRNFTHNLDRLNYLKIKISRLNRIKVHTAYKPDEFTETI